MTTMTTDPTLLRQHVNTLLKKYSLDNSVNDTECQLIAQVMPLDDNNKSDDDDDDSKDTSSSSSDISSKSSMYICIIQSRSKPYFTALMLLRRGPTSQIAHFITPLGNANIQNRDGDDDDPGNDDGIVIIGFYAIHANAFSMEVHGELGFELMFKMEDSTRYVLEALSRESLADILSNITAAIKSVAQSQQTARSEGTLDTLMNVQRLWSDHYKSALVGARMFRMKELMDLESQTTQRGWTPLSPETLQTAVRSQSMRKDHFVVDVAKLDQSVENNDSSSNNNGTSSTVIAPSRSKHHGRSNTISGGMKSSAIMPDGVKGSFKFKNKKAAATMPKKQKSPLSMFSSTPELDSDDLFGSRKRPDESINKLASSQVKDEWIRRQLKIRSNEFTEKNPLTVVIGTWNVGSKLPSSSSSSLSLSSWLHTDEHEADVYAIGLQEVDMTAGALLREETDAGYSWTVLIETFFKSLKSTYQILRWRQLVGLYMCIVVKKDHVPHLKDVRVTSEGVGVLGMMGNKGGVAMRFQLHETTFCFINVHLAAHTGAVSQRNQNFHDIMRRTVFNGGNTYHPESHDHFFWFGDLNYRIQLPDNECRKLIKKDNIAALLKHDQLLLERSAGRVMVGFEEGPITFMPTYKFDIGTVDHYDTSEKRRVPSYTDRILWKKNVSYKVNQTLYTMHPEYTVSDHKPVVAMFDIEVKVIEEEKYRSCYRELLKMLDKMENDMLPEVELSAKELVFDNVLYNIPVKRTITLENTGQVVCEFSFLKKPADDAVAKSWLQIEPHAGIIIPGEKAELKFTVWVDHSTAPMLNEGKDTIDDILILHLKNGRDHFISISGKYLHSCFGNSLSRLVKMHKSVRELQSLQACGEEPSSNDDDDARDLKLPKELWKLVDYIYKNGLREPDLFKESGDSFEVNDIRERLDTDQSLEHFNGSIHSVAEALIGFLESLSEPVVPKKHYMSCINAFAKFETSKLALGYLPTEHYNVFHYVMALLRERLHRCKENSTTADELAIIFSRVMMRHPREAMPNASQQAAAASFIKQFLRNDVDWTKEEILR